MLLASSHTNKYRKEYIMRGKIALEEHVSTPENNRLWDSTGEAGRNGTE
ncbi:amidohydrolase family protein, partial [Klebsiella variicola]